MERKNINKREMKLITPATFPFHFEKNISQSCDQQNVISLITLVCWN